MRRRQKKVEEFLGGLKVGDKVVTTGGHLRQHHPRRRRSAAAADRRQGPRRGLARRHRRLPGPGAGRRARRRGPVRRRNHEQEPPLEDSSPSLARRSSLCVVAVLSARRQKVRLGLDLKGGVHLVLRVQTDDALRLETETDDGAAARRAGEGRRRGRDRRQSLSRHRVPDRRRARRPGRAVPQRGDRGRARPTTASPASAAPTRFQMKPNIANQLRDETVTQAIRTIERRVNELGVAEPIVARQGARRSDPGAAARRHRRARAKEIIRSTALLELKLVEQGPRQLARTLLQAQRRHVPPDSEVVPGRRERPRQPRPAPSSTTSCSKRAGRHRPRPAQREADARREQPAGGAASR